MTIYNTMTASPHSAHHEHTMRMQQTSPPSGLQGALHAATRGVHANLNRTITARLPLCLPPHAHDPTAYRLGMLVFGQIFERFEQEIQRPFPSTYPEARHLDIVGTQHTDGLSRTNNWRADSKLLSKRLKETVYLQNPDLLEEIEERVNAAAYTQTRAIGEHIQEKPYLALAYTWTMYLALFNGGRWLHKQLASAGPAFWLEDLQPSEADSTNENATNGNISTLSFWRFDTATQEDPEANQLKITFKQHFDKASSLLTENERDEVVQEAKFIFELCMRLIGILDEVMLEMGQARVEEEHLEVNADAVSLAMRVWQSLSSAVLTPAYSLVGWGQGWMRPLKPEVKAGE